MPGDGMTERSLMSHVGSWTEYVRGSAPSLSCGRLFVTHGLEPTKLLFHGILQGRTLEWVAMPPSRGSSQPRDQTHISCIGRWMLYHCATWETPDRTKALGKNQGDLNVVSSCVSKNASVLVLYLWQIYSTNQRY